MWLNSCVWLSCVVHAHLATMSACSMCGAHLSVRGGGICFGCRTSGHTLLFDTKLAVLGYCPDCGGRLRGKGKGYCHGKSQGTCKAFTKKSMNITQAIDEEIKPESMKQQAPIRPPRPTRKRSLEMANMFDEDPLVHLRRCEFFAPHLSEQRKLGRHDKGC